MGVTWEEFEANGHRLDELFSPVPQVEGVCGDGLVKKEKPDEAELTP